MEIVFDTLAAFAAGAWLVLAAHRLGQARNRLALLRRQRRRDHRR